MFVLDNLLVSSPSTSTNYNNAATSNAEEITTFTPLHSNTHSNVTISLVCLFFTDDDVSSGQPPHFSTYHARTG